ncbi:MAG: SDR family oxidoreductase [Bacteroidota bacterium]
MADKIERIGVLGSGWLGLPLVGHLARSGRYHLLATTRSSEKLEDIKQAGASPILLNLPTSQKQITDTATQQLLSADALIITLPPGRSRANTFQAYQAEISSVIVLAKMHNCGHLLYTSSTGVYGRAEGLLDEQSSTVPITESARAVLWAEQAFRDSGIPATILRLAGLYGPGRNPGKWFQGRPIKQADAPVNLVHQQDVIRAIELVIEHSSWGQVYNVCGHEHPPKSEIYTKAAKALGLEPPTSEAGGVNGKMVSSEKIRTHLGWSSRSLSGLYE